MNPHFYAELGRVSNEELDRAARAHRDRSATSRAAPKPATAPTRGSRVLALARLRPAAR